MILTRPIDNEEVTEVLPNPLKKNLKTSKEKLIYLESSSQDLSDQELYGSGVDENCSEIDSEDFYLNNKQDGYFLRFLSAFEIK